MRVAYLTGRYPAVSHTFVLREIRALRRLGVEITPLSIWSTAATELISAAEREEAVSTYALLPPRRLDWGRAHAAAASRAPARYWGALVTALRLAPSTPRGLMLGVLWFLEAMVLWDRCRRRGADHVHVHLNGTAPSVALVAHEYAGDALTFSMTVHGPSEFYDVHAEALAEKARRATAVVCVSDFARSQLMGLVDEAHWSKLRVVHCGVDPSLFAPRPRAAGDGSLRLLCVGRLVGVKGQGVLLDALARLVERGVGARATFVGDGPRRDALERRAAELGLEDRARFLGSISQEEIRDHYAAADIFCLPSFAEGVPVVLMEAMAMELPVVATTVMGIGELIEDGVSGLLVRPARPDLLADALERLAGDSALRAELGGAGRRAVVEGFDVERSARQLFELFASMRGRKQRSAPLNHEVPSGHG